MNAHFALYPGLLAPVFVTCNTNMGEGLVKLMTSNDVPGPKKRRQENCPMLSAQSFYGSYLRLVAHSLAVSRNVPLLHASRYITVCDQFYQAFHHVSTISIDNRTI